MSLPSMHGSRRFLISAVDGSGPLQMVLVAMIGAAILLSRLYSNVKRSYTN